MLWFKKYTINELEAFNVKHNMVSLLGIKLLEITDEYLIATMPVDDRTRQVYGLLHGGATCVLVETVASIASMLCIDPDKFRPVGSQISVNHLRPITEGVVVATCNNIHLGKQKHVWDVLVHSQDSGKLIAKGELTVAIVDAAIK